MSVTERSILDTWLAERSKRQLHSSLEQRVTITSPGNLYVCVSVNNLADAVDRLFIIHKQ